MKVFNIPLDQFGTPFNKAWKRVLMQLLIALFIGAIVYHFVKSETDQIPALYVKIVFYIFLVDIGMAFIHILISVKLDQKYDWIKDTRKRVGYAIFFHIAGTFFIYFTIPLLYIHYIYGASFSQAFIGLANYWFIPFTLASFIIIFAVAGQFFKNWKKSIASEAKLHAEMMSYKYEALRNQINPHFLLDGFKYMKDLVVRDKPKAVSFIHSISALYRHVLEVKDKELIKLSEELIFIQSYIELLRLRYGDQLNISVDLTTDQDDLITPLSLQFLIENAVENNLRSANDLLKITVTKKNNHIEIANSKTGKKQHIDLKSNALKNLEQQYQFYSQKPLEFLETEDLFSIRIPILKHA